MLSVASVRSAAGAAGYFAKDDYYTAEHSSEMSLWDGSGAAGLGLEGEVSKDDFENILNGQLPNGEKVGQVENRQAGVDFTFSMPKSASVMAYIAGDKRVLQANMTAVQSTMAWVEKNLAEGRKDIEGKKVPIKTGNLVYALFQHDTSRALDPQGHVHAVIANMTRMPDGKMQALHNGALWKNNSVIGSIYHAFLREQIEKLGYQVEARGKHGTFEIVGVPRPVLEAFSQRREAILAKAAELGITTTQGLRDVTQRSRDPKLNVEDREGLQKDWIEKAAGLGFDGKELLAAAKARAGKALNGGPLERGYRAVTEAIGSARTALGALLRPYDPLVDAGLARLTQSPSEARAQLAVASAVRILSQREAAFNVHLLSKTALDLNLKGVTVDQVERRVERLVKNGQLIPEASRRHDGAITMVTTPEALRTEERILAEVERGRGQAAPIVAAADAPSRLREVADRELNASQLGAATLILSSEDRTVVVQGVAGAGKSTMLHAVSRVAAAEQRNVIGLAFQNKMVGDLQEGTGIRSQTVASFVLANERFIREREGPRYEAARQAMASTMLVVDETSMISSDDMLRLHEITAALGVEKLVLVGDRQQLSSIDAGKSFALIQAGGGTMARMDQNIRQRTDELRTVAALANVGKAGQAMKVLGDKVVENPNPAEHAAALWLALPHQEREVTAVFASGRDSRAVINQRIQDGLAVEGSVKGEGIHLTVFERVNLTREELRYASNYRAGQTLDVAHQAHEIGLGRGRYDVTRVLPSGKIEVTNGRRRFRFDPQKLSPHEKRGRLELTERKNLHLREGDRIRWTANDKDRGIHNSALARVLSTGASGVTVETAAKERLTLALGDPMLSRVDLAYSLNMHMAQGITTDKAITVMSSHERNLSNQRLFNVGVTRVRDELIMVVDDKAKLERQLDLNPGNKTSALEAVGRLAIDGKQGGSPERFDPGPLDKIQLPDLPRWSPEAPAPAREGDAQKSGERSVGDLKAPPDLKTDKSPTLPLPERSLGLDL